MCVSVFFLGWVLDVLGGWGDFFWSFFLMVEDLARVICRRVLEGIIVY
jgi:hypothetical protein